MRTTWKTLLCTAVITSAAVAQAPKTPDVAKLKARLEVELAKPFVKYGGWVTDYDEARKRARTQKKVMFGYFTRSYAH